MGSNGGRTPGSGRRGLRERVNQATKATQRNRSLLKPSSLLWPLPRLLCAPHLPAGARLHRRCESRKGHGPHRQSLVELRRRVLHLLQVRRCASGGGGDAGQCHGPPNAVCVRPGPSHTGSHVWLCGTAHGLLKDGPQVPAHRLLHQRSK